MATPTYTYTNDPASVPIDAVRWLVGDNATDGVTSDVINPLVSDQEILFAIQQRGVGYGAAWLCANAIAGKFAQQVTATAGKLSVQASDKAKQYRELAASLWQMIVIGAKPKFGGVFVADKQRADMDSSTLQPSFKREQYDNPEASQEDNQGLIIGPGGNMS